MDIDLPPQWTWIDGEHEPSEAPGADALFDPNTGELLQETRFSSPEQVERALASAWAVHQAGTWQRLSVDERGEFLLALADRLDELQSQIAVLDSLNSGVTLRETTLFASSNGDTIRSAVSRARARRDVTSLSSDHGPVSLRRVAWGPTALIAPWNAPAAVAVKKMAYALISGAPVVLKPSPVSPWSSELIAQATVDVGLPRGVFSLLLGDGAVGNQICSDPRIKAISMTGSTPTGKRIAQASAANLTRLRLELGSNNPALVLGDADIEATTESLVEGMTKLNGQWCEAPRRVFVDRSVYPAVVESLVERTNRVTVGSSFDEATGVGPMAFRKRLEDLVEQRDLLAKQGASISSDTEVPTDGWFFAPTIVSGEGLELTSELFGPMLVVEPFDSLDAAVASANEGSHGLAGYVFGSDIPRSIAVGARLDAGEIKINGTSLLDMSPDSAQSFFGDSGLGGHGDADVLDFYSGKQVLGLDLVDAPI